MKQYALGLRKSPYDCRDYKFEKLLKTIVSVPDSLDNRDKVSGGVKYQGNYPTCLAFASSSFKEVQENIDIGFNDKMSPQFIYNLRKNFPEDGMYMRDACEILVNYGIVEEKVYPYESSWSNNIPSDILSQGKKYHDLYYASINTIDGLKQAVVQNGGCLLALPVYNYGQTFWKRQTGQYLLGGHGTLNVGYGKITGFNQEGILGQNSWGLEWYGGYFLIPWEDFDEIWEVWTLTDDKTIIPPKKKCWLINLLQKIWNWIFNLFRK
jgi:hypothetical protein